MKTSVFKKLVKDFQTDEMVLLCSSNFTQNVYNKIVKQMQKKVAQTGRTYTVFVIMNKTPGNLKTVEYTGERDGFHIIAYAQDSHMI